MLTATGTSVELRDELTGETTTVTARTVVNATGVWAGDLVPEVTLRPSRGTHLVLRGSSIPGLRTSVFAPIPGTTGRFINVLPQPDGTIYIGLTDEPVDGDIPDVPEPSEPEIGFLLDVASAAFAQPLHRSDVVGAYAGLRPLLASGDGSGTTSDLSRRHAVLTSTTGVITIVGGKLTTYRRMARGRRRRRGRPRRARRRSRAAPPSCRCSAPPRGRGSPSSRSRPGWSAASAPTPGWCSTTPAPSAGSATTSCSRRSPRASRSPWPS